VFDETWFPTLAYNYFQGLPVFDLHPPLGKLILVAGIVLLENNTPLAWRVMPALFGSASLALVYWPWRHWKHRPWMVVAFVACMAATALCFLPTTMALPMSPESLRQRVWLESWLGGWILAPKLLASRRTS
jgi:dolichyl-phosphate-mannose--protein O-mannosyl transferase